ncbi:hypothetical protein BUALT_Bualt05G0113300 [Buddleja alternifolia]|uniref:Uncharacterized protein n=1 Tax=Buddleja alternifolia TaxID=168488 RepID=A0AAV6XIJ9_9LAMI|nr:hypothetical protein BUALT_Bualt05G0113300 [Buddleja alternifolia]
MDLFPAGSSALRSSRSSRSSGSHSSSTSQSENQPSVSPRPLIMGSSGLQILPSEPLSEPLTCEVTSARQFLPKLSPALSEGNELVDVISESSSESDPKRIIKTSSEFESIISPGDLVDIRKEYHIPPNFELLAPLPGQYMFDPPPDYRVSFGCSRGGVMQFFEVEPSWKHFWTLYSLISSPQSSGKNLPFFYLSPRQSCKFLHDLPNSLGDWKESFVFVKAPPDLPWQIPHKWRQFKPKPSSSGDVTWDPDFIQDSLTLTWFDDTQLLSEEILCLARISPATIPLIQSLDMATRDAMVANKMREESERLLALGRSRRAPIPRSSHSNLLMPPPSSAPSRGSTPTSEVHPNSQLSKDGGRELGSPGPNLGSRERVIMEKRSSHDTDKDQGSGSKTTKSHKRKDTIIDGHDQVKKCRSGAKGKTPEGSQVLPDKNAGVSPRSIELLHKWYNDSRARFHGPRAPEGESAILPFSEPKDAPFAVNLALTKSSSILNSIPGETSYDLYRSLILPKDEATLFPLDYFQIEDRSAHHLMLTGLHLRHLTLKCAYWHHEFRAVDKRLQAFESDRSTFPTLKKKLEADNAKILASLEAALKREEEKEGVLSEAQKRVSSLESNLDEMRRKFAAMTSLLEEEKQKAYTRGRQEEQTNFFQSPTYHDLEKRLKMEGVQEFQQSPEFENILLSKAAEDTYLGFIKCQDQFVALGGVKEGFDLGMLKPFEEILLPDDTPNVIEDPSFLDSSSEAAPHPAV